MFLQGKFVFIQFKQNKRIKKKRDRAAVVGLSSETTKEGSQRRELRRREGSVGRRRRD